MLLMQATCVSCILSQPAGLALKSHRDMKKALNLLFGLGIGFALALLLAPASGEETRGVLVDKARRIIRLPGEKIEEKIQEKMEETADAAKEKAGELGSRVGREAAEAAVEGIRQEVLGKNRPA